MEKKVDGRTRMPAITMHESRDLVAHHDEIKATHDHSHEREMRSAKFQATLKKYLHGSVIDFGSANGQIFNVLKDIGITETSGADIGNYLSVGEPTKGLSAFDFTRDTFPYADNTFDGATNIEVIEHLENPYHFIREVYRVLKPGAVFIITTPNPNHLWNVYSFARHGDFYRFLKGNNHIMFFAQYILKKGVLKYFDLVETSYLFGEMPAPLLRHMLWPDSKRFGRTVVYVLRKKAAL